MVERNGTLGTAGGRPDQLCCVSVNKVFDSARDKDCLEDLRVHLSDFAQEIVPEPEKRYWSPCTRTSPGGSVPLRKYMII